MERQEANESDPVEKSMFGSEYCVDSDSDDIDNFGEAVTEKNSEEEYDSSSDEEKGDREDAFKGESKGTAAKKKHKKEKKKSALVKKVEADAKPEDEEAMLNMLQKLETCEDSDAEDDFMTDEAASLVPPIKTKKNTLQAFAAFDCEDDDEDATDETDKKNDSGSEDERRQEGYDSVEEQERMEEEGSIALNAEELAIRDQVEYYFSDANYSKDKHLHKVASSYSGYIPIGELLKFNKLRALTTEPTQVARAMRGSMLVVFSADRRKLKKVTPSMRSGGGGGGGGGASNGSGSGGNKKKLSGSVSKKKKGSGGKKRPNAVGSESVGESGAPQPTSEMIATGTEKAIEAQVKTAEPTSSGTRRTSASASTEVGQNASVGPAEAGVASVASVVSVATAAAPAAKTTLGAPSSLLSTEENQRETSSLSTLFSVLMILVAIAVAFKSI